MIPAIMFLIITIILKATSSLGPSIEKVIIIISYPLALFLLLTVITDLFKNIPNTLQSDVHPNRDPTADDPGESYKYLWKKQKKHYLMIILISLLIRGATIFLIGDWFIFT